MKYLTKQKFSLSIIIYFVFTIFSLIISLRIGAENLDFKKIFDFLFSNSSSDDSRLFYFSRLPRVLMAFIAGGTFAVCGLAFQIVFKNPLATPYTTGVTSGGTLGAVVAISYPALNFNFGITSVQLFSQIGSLLVLLLIFTISSNKKGNMINTVLLSGISIGILFTALVMLIRYILTPNLLVVVDRWMMGGLDISGYNDFAGIFPFLIPGLSLLFSQSIKMNYLVSGDETAFSRGINANSVNKIILIGGSLAVASVVSVVGPVAFIGLIVPHIVKKISGNDTRLLMPACFLFGGAFLMLCDAIARLIIRPAELPVGIITAVLGGGYFIYLINIRKR